MKKRNNLLSILLCGICCMALLGGCGEPADKAAENPADASAAGDVQADAEPAGEGSLGEFSMEDIEGNTYTQDMFADYSLTMVNVFTTWCTPCINEIPDLEKLRNEMADQGVNVVGIALDAIDATGSADGETVEKAKILAEQTGVTYPFLIPDAGYLNGRLMGINAVPETFFVDKNGTIVGETYTGSRSLDEWKSVVEQELQGVAQ